MKICLTVLSLMFIAHISFGQWTNSATVSNNDLSTKLNLPPTSGSTSSISILTNNGNMAGGFGLINGANVVSPTIWMYNYGGINAFTVAKAGYFESGPDHLLEYMTPLFQVRENGNVGIGTTNPNAMLDVAGTIVNGGGDFLIGTRDGRNQGSITSNRALVHSDWGIGNDNLVINFQGDFESGVNIQGPKTVFDGNVGIGTSNPNAKLAVNGNISASGLEFPYSWAPDPAYVGSPGNYISFGHTGSSEDFIGYKYNTFYFKDTPGGGDTNQPNVIVGGKLGIGTDAIDATLTVKGDIHTKEVRVDVSGSMVGDYVFEKDYNLISLPELETYLKQNKHLPEVPSAKEFEAEGMKLKEMNLILLKKVEELTLYLIEQNRVAQKETRELQLLKQQSEKQQSEIETLKEAFNKL